MLVYPETNSLHRWQAFRNSLSTSERPTMTGTASMEGESHRLFSNREYMLIHLDSLASFPTYLSKPAPLAVFRPLLFLLFPRYHHQPMSQNRPGPAQQQFHSSVRAYRVDLGYRLEVEVVMQHDFLLFSHFAPVILLYVIACRIPCLDRLGLSRYSCFNISTL